MSTRDITRAAFGSSINNDLEAILLSVFDSTSNGVMIVDSSGTIVGVNPAFSKITGYDADDVVGHKPNILNSGRQDNDFYTSMWASLRRHDHWEGEIWNRRKDGKIYPEWLSISVVRDHGGDIQYYVGTFSDISAIKTSEDRLIQLAFHDPLTGLPNRVLFHDRLSHTLTHAKREQYNFAVLFIDLDGFKQINDSCGHTVGDAVLMETASRLQRNVRESDTVARLAGDEFTIIADRAGSISDITTVAVNILNAMKADFIINDHHLSCGVSMGIAIYPESGTDAATLLKNADTAMYQVKKAGKNGFRFHALPGARRRSQPQRMDMAIAPRNTLPRLRSAQR